MIKDDFNGITYENNNLKKFLQKFKYLEKHKKINNLKLNNLNLVKDLLYIITINHYLNYFKMTLSLYYFFLISSLILFSTIGYGLLFTKLLKFENFNYNYGLIGILGLFFLSVIASFTHYISASQLYS